MNNYCILILSNSNEDLDRLLGSLTAAQSNLQTKDVFIVAFFFAFRFFL